MSTTTLQLDQFVDPFEAKVVYQRDASGAIIDARFDLSGLPRLDPLLVGKHVETVPDIVKRLCGICPVTHHLAGMRALDQLFDAPAPPTAQLVRRLLNAGSILDASAPKFFAAHRELAVNLRAVGKQAMAAAGSPGHFPDVAVPGGVRSAVDREGAAEIDVEPLLAQLRDLPADPEWQDTFTGLSVALTHNGHFDALGDTLTLSNGETIAPADFSRHVTESVPGSSAPRPLIDGQPYRVGPVAHAAIANANLGPLRSVKGLLIRSALDIQEILADSDAYEGQLVAPGALRAGEGIGLVEGPRGLLMHRYVADEQGLVTECQILTPTAQNESWLAQMLRESLQDGSNLEGSIRAADPCLPISSAPDGAMGITVAEED